jgi:dihydroceramidase
MQLLDELSMIYMACTTLYALFSFNKSNAGRLLVFTCTFCIAVFITLYYHFLKDPTFHQNMFTLLAATATFKGIYDMELLLRPYWRQKAQARNEYMADGPSVFTTAVEQAEMEKRDIRILNSMWSMVLCGIFAIGLGFFIWSLDNIFCQDLRRWRHQIGLPWGIVLEGHGWW